MADRGRALGSRAGWTIADQAISSIGNAGLSLLIARAVDASSFGAFTVAFVVFTIVIGLNRGWIVEPLVIGFSGESTAGSFRGAVRDCGGASLVAGAAAGLLCAAAALVFRGQVGAALLALAVCLPGLLVQDAWRHALFAARRPRDATLNDLLWTSVQFGGTAVLIATGRASVVSIILVWGAGAALGALLGVAQLSAAPRPSATREWLQTHRSLGSGLGLSFLVNTGAVSVAVFLVGAVAGLAAAGSLRAAQTLVGPLQALFAALNALALPILAGRVADARETDLRPVVALSGVLGAVSAAWLALLLLLPRAAGEQLLGDSWAGAREVLPGIGFVVVVVAVATGPGLLLMAWSEASLLLRSTVFQAPFILLLSGGGALADGARGAATGLAAAHLVGTSLICVYAHRVVRRNRAAAEAA